MTDWYFVDTNVLVYARDSSEPQKHALAVEWIHTLCSQGSGRLSFQVLEEYYQVLTRRLPPASIRKWLGPISAIYSRGSRYRQTPWYLKQPGPLRRDSVSPCGMR